jgi:hypothetical protein
MPLTMTDGDVRKLIEAEHLGWQRRADMPDYVRLRNYALGGTTEGLIPTSDAPALDLRTLGVGTNPFLAVQRVERGLVSVDAVRESFSSQLLSQLGLDDRMKAVAGPVTDAAYGIGVGKDARPPRPPNCACGSPAHSSPVGSFLIGIGSPEHRLRVR